MGTPILNKPTSLCSTPENCETPAQSGSSSSSGKQPMSIALRERLKKARRSFNSTFTVAKRLKINEENNYNNYEEKTVAPKGPYSTSQDEDECLGHVSGETRCLKSVFQERERCQSKQTQNSPQALLCGTDCSQWELLEEKMKLMTQIQEKEDRLRRLKLVKMYRSKNNPAELQCLIAKWRRSSQTMLYDLQTASSTDGKKLSLTELIDCFGLDDKLLHYIRTEEDFEDE